MNASEYYLNSTLRQHLEEWQSHQKNWVVPVASSVLLGVGVHVSLSFSPRGLKFLIGSAAALVMAVLMIMDSANPGSPLSREVFMNGRFAKFDFGPNIFLFCLPLVAASMFSALNRFVHECIKLFFNKKFTHHRWLGLVYLIQFFTACIMYVANYDWFVNSHLVWSLPLNGVIQSITATIYFSFLPSKADGGYCSDRSALSFEFVAENIFFAGILLGQWLYYSDWVSNALPIPVFLKMFIENFFVFLPYIARLAFPQTRFRDSINDPNNKSVEQKQWWVIVTYITKAFYIWAKHYMGFFLNYVRFLDRVTEEQQYHVFGMLIFSCAATTIALFLHTLAFKHYITKRTSFMLYMMSYGLTFYSWVRMYDIFLVNIDLVLLTAIGLLINFKARSWQFGYQFVLLGVLNASRYGYFSFLSR